MKQAGMIVGVLFGLAIIGSAVYINRDAFVPPAANTVSNPAPVSTQLPMTSTHIARNLAVGNFICSVDASFPQIDAASSLSADERTSINQQITDAAAMLIGNGEGKKGDTPDAQADAFVAACKSELTADPTTAIEGWDSTVENDITQNQDGILSVGLSWDGFTGGAHPNASSNSLVFDLKTGKRFSNITEIIAPGKTQAVALLIAQHLVDEQGTSLFDVDSYDAFIAHPTDAEATKLLTANGQFTLSGDGVSIHYDPYEIAPYTTGPIDVDLSWDELNGAVTVK